MSVECHELHRLFNSKHIFRFPFDERGIPWNGIYVLFEKGEFAHGTKRIVRVGTHTGKDQLRSRLFQHFLVENKDRSIFRKNIGRCLLNKKEDAFLAKWDLDYTPKQARKKKLSPIDIRKQKVLEKQVSRYIQERISFIVIPVESNKTRLDLESKIISTVSLCEECFPSPFWLGNFSPKVKIRESGLWLVNELYKTPVSKKEIKQLKRLLAGN